MDEETIKANITSPDTWLRLLLMIVFGIVASVLIYLVWIIAAVQFISSVITNKVNQNLDEFSANLVTYLTRIFEYLVYRSDVRPFPFSPWDEMVSNSESAISKKAASTKKRTTKPKAAKGKEPEKENEAETEKEAE